MKGGLKKCKFVKSTYYTPSWQTAIIYEDLKLKHIFYFLVDEVEEANEEDYDSGGSGVALTPPDSPRVPSYMAANGALIDPEKDIYAIPSRASSQKREIYFLALVDILTQYGM